MSRVGLAVWPTFKAVGWRAALLIAASLCFEGMVALRDWHTQYAVSRVWGEEVAKRDAKWARVVARAAVNMEARTYPSKEHMFDAIGEFVQDAKNWPLPAERHVSRYHAALERRKTLRADLEERLDAVDSEFAPKSRSRVAYARSSAAEERKSFEASVKTLVADLAALNAERAAIEFAYSKRIDAVEREIKSADDGVRAAFEEGAKYARPVGEGTAAAFRLHAGNEADARHIVYVLLWYGLEGLVLALLFAVALPLLLILSGGSTPDTLKPTFMQRVRQLLGGVFGQRTVATVGKAVAALAIGTAGVVGMNAAAGDSPPVIPVITHPTNGTSVEGKPGEPGQPGQPAEIPPEIAKKLEEQAATLKEQALTLAQQKELIDLVNTNLGDVSTRTKATAASAEKLAADAQTMATNMTGLAATASTTGMTLGSLNNGMSQVVEAQRFSLLASSAAARQLNESVTGLQLATAQTANGVTHVATQAAELAKVDSDLHATTIQVSAIGDGFLRPINPFYVYKVTPEAVETVLKATNRSTAQAAKLAEALRFMGTQKPMRGRAFRNTLRNNTDVSAHALLDQLMPLILKVSCGRGGNDGQSEPVRVAVNP